MMSRRQFIAALLASGASGSAFAAPSSIDVYLDPT